VNYHRVGVEDTNRYTDLEDECVVQAGDAATAPVDDIELYDLEHAPKPKKHDKAQGKRTKKVKDTEKTVFKLEGMDNVSETSTEKPRDANVLYAKVGAVMSDKWMVASVRREDHTLNHASDIHDSWQVQNDYDHPYHDPGGRYTAAENPPEDVVVFVPFVGKLVPERLLNDLRAAVCATTPTEVTVAGWHRIFAAKWVKLWQEMKAFGRGVLTDLSPHVEVLPVLVGVVMESVQATTRELRGLSEHLNNDVHTKLDDMKHAMSLQAHEPHLAKTAVSVLPAAVKKVLIPDLYKDHGQTLASGAVAVARLWDASNATQYEHVTTNFLAGVHDIIDRLLARKTGGVEERCPHGKVQYTRCQYCNVSKHGLAHYLSLGTHLPLCYGVLSVPLVVYSGTPEPLLKPIAKDVRWSDGSGVTDWFKPGAYLVGIGDLTAIPVPVSANSSNLTTALRNRFVHDIPEPNKELWNLFKRFVAANRHVLFPGVRQVDPVPFDKWLSCFPEATRTRLLECAERVRNGTSMPRTACGVFTKTEKTMMSVDVLPMIKVPRPIVPWIDEYIIDFAPQVHAMYAEVKRCWRSSYFLTYGAGLDGVELGAWFLPLYPEGDNLIPSTDWAKFDNDMTTYDRCQHRGCFDVAHMVFKWMGLRGAAERAFKRQFQTQLRSRYGHHVKCGSVMKSGVPNTALQNTILNLTMHVFVFSLVLGRPLRKLMGEMRMIGNGDDNVTIVRLRAIEEAGYTLERFRATCESLFQKLGMLPKLNLREDHSLQINGCNITFASVRGVDRPVATPMLGRLGPKIGYSLLPQNATPQWLNGVVQGTTRLTRVVPFLRHWVDAQSDATFATQLVQVERKYAIKTNLAMSPASYTLELLRSGCGDAEEAAFCSWLSELRKPCLVAHPVLAAHKHYA